MRWNKIESLLDKKDIWSNDRKDIKRVMGDYFRNIFSSKGDMDIKGDWELVELKVTNIWG